MAISTAYFPLLWPAAQKANLTLDLDTAYLSIACHDCQRRLRRDLGQAYVCPANEITHTRSETHTRVTQINAANGEQTTVINDDFGEFTFLAHNLTVGEVCHEEHAVLPHEPHSANSFCKWHLRQVRPGWEIDVYTSLKVTCDAQYFYLNATLEALENGQQVH